MSNFAELGGLITESRAEPFPCVSPAHGKATDSAFADTLARCTTPLFSPWPLTAPLRHETVHSPDQAMTTRPADQRRDRRQRSRE